MTNSNTPDSWKASSLRAVMLSQITQFSVRMTSLALGLLGGWGIAADGTQGNQTFALGMGSLAGSAVLFGVDWIVGEIRKSKLATRSSPRPSCSKRSRRRFRRRTPATSTPPRSPLNRPSFHGDRRRPRRTPTPQQSPPRLSTQPSRRSHNSSPRSSNPAKSRSIAILDVAGSSCISSNHRLPLTARPRSARSPRSSRSSSSLRT
jgi:hypothetical protein